MTALKALIYKGFRAFSFCPFCFATLLQHVPPEKDFATDEIVPCGYVFSVKNDNQGGQANRIRNGKLHYIKLTLSRLFPEWDAGGFFYFFAILGGADCHLCPNE